MQKGPAFTTKDNVWVLGDFNYPKFSWDADHVPTTKQGCGFPSLYDDFMTLISDFSFTQMVTELPRLDNVRTRLTPDFKSHFSSES